MSTNRRPRSARLKHHELRQPEKPLCKIADLPEPERLLMREFIRIYVHQQHPDQALGTTFDTATQAIEGLIDKGVVKIVMDKSPASSSTPEDIPFHIVPTGKY